MLSLADWLQPLARFPALRDFGARRDPTAGGWLSAFVLDELRLGAFLVIVCGHGPIEALETFGDVAHEARDPAGSKQEHEDQKDKKDMPPAQPH